MNNMVYFIDYNKGVGIKKKIFFKIKKEKLNENSTLLLLNSVITSEKRLLKLVKYLEKIEAKYIVLSNDLKELSLKIRSRDFSILAGKVLMNKMILKILEHIAKCQSKELALSDVYVTVNNVINEGVIIDLAKKCKSINIVTSKIKKIRRLEQKLENQENVIYSIANNTKKSLKRAELIVNLDCDSSFFEKYTINRKAIIVNLSNEELHIKGKTQGAIIEDITIEDEIYEKNKLSNFAQSSVYEAKIIEENDNWSKATNTLNINSLIGKNGAINIYEFNNNI